LIGGPVGWHFEGWNIFGFDICAVLVLSLVLIDMGVDVDINVLGILNGQIDDHDNI